MHGRLDKSAGAKCRSTESDQTYERCRWRVTHSIEMRLSLKRKKNLIKSKWESRSSLDNRPEKNGSKELENRCCMAIQGKKSKSLLKIQAAPRVHYYWNVPPKNLHRKRNLTVERGGNHNRLRHEINKKSTVPNWNRPIVTTIFSWQKVQDFLIFWRISQQLAKVKWRQLAYVILESSCSLPGLLVLRDSGCWSVDLASCLGWKTILFPFSLFFILRI